jgi:hypothetical protein
MDMKNTTVLSLLDIYFKFHNTSFLELMGNTRGYLVMVAKETDKYYIKEHFDDEVISHSINFFLDNKDGIVEHAINQITYLILNSDNEEIKKEYEELILLNI